MIWVDINELLEQTNKKINDWNHCKAEHIWQTYHNKNAEFLFSSFLAQELKRWHFREWHKKVSSKQNVHGIMYIISCCHSNIKTLFSHTVHTKVYSVFYPLSLPSRGVMASICKQLLIRPFFINQMYLFHKLNIENKAYCLSNVWTLFFLPHSATRVGIKCFSVICSPRTLSWQP